MADKKIFELVAAEKITASDMFVLEQNGTAKKLTGQVLLNWLTAAADGHGGIQSYTLQKTEGLVKTYRFTLADKSYMDIQIIDGRGIRSVEKVDTIDLVDIYQIRYSDDTTSEFFVTNGEKGDKGDSAQIWIRYASQKPTYSSNDFGEVPDAWIGIASGHSPTAPTDWREYQWFQWKGEKGDTGDPGTLVGSEVTYQSGSYGHIIPSGSWTTNIPVVQPGNYLWTRIVHQFNTGDPVISYCVSRMGLDGLGSVSSVAGLAPDADGNVPLSAYHINALSLSGGILEGNIDMRGFGIFNVKTPVTSESAANKYYVDTYAEKKKLSFSYPVVYQTIFTYDSENIDYPYRADIPLEGVDRHMIPEVIFNLTDATSGIFAPVAEAYDGGVSIWASVRPTERVYIPQILCWRS